MEWSAPIYGEFYERFHPDAFKKCLAGNPDIYACIDHDTKRILGRTGANTLKLDNRSDGLHTVCMNNGTSYANDLERMIGSGDIAGMSFQFRYKETGVPERHNGLHAITVMEADLREVCFTIMPCYPSTDANHRSRELPDSSFWDLETVALDARDRRLRMLKVFTTHSKIA